MKARAIAGLVLSVFIMASPAGAGEVTSPGAALQVGGVVKWLYGWSLKDDETLNPGRDAMTTSMADVRLDWAINEKISFYIETAATWDQDTGAGSLGSTPSNPGESGTFGVRQVSITLDDYLPWTTVKLGTFIPPITNYMPRKVEDLDLISYPLMNNAVNMDAGIYGNRPAARDLSTWQQAGVNFTIQPPYMLKLDVGFWNGIMPNNLANQDSNVAYATSIVLTFQPRDEISLSMAYWGEEFEQAYPGIARGANRELTVWYLYGAYETELLEVYADYAEARINEMQIDTTGEFQELAWNGWQVTVGYWIVPKVQILGRYEYFDPNTADSVELPQSRYDESRWLTLGANWVFLDHAEVSLNYVFKNELAEPIEEGDPEKDPTYPATYDNKYSAQNNDTLLIQVQVWQ